MYDGSGIIGMPLALGEGGLSGNHNPKCFKIFQLHPPVIGDSSEV